MVHVLARSGGLDRAREARVSSVLEEQPRPPRGGLASHTLRSVPSCPRPLWGLRPCPLSPSGDVPGRAHWCGLVLPCRAPQRAASMLCRRRLPQRRPSGPPHLRGPRSVSLLPSHRGCSIPCLSSTFVNRQGSGSPGDERELTRTHHCGCGNRPQTWGG